MLNIQDSVSLTHLNTLHLISHATKYAVVHNLEQLELLQKELSNHAKFFVLGGGSNLILPEHYEGLVIHNQLHGISIADYNNDYYSITAMAGENWDTFIAYCIKNGCYGLENLSLIPGTVGAAPVQNIGAYGVEVKDFIDYVTVYDWETGNTINFSNSDCKFTYRNSYFKNKNRYFVISVTFKLLKIPKLNCSYGEVAKHLTEIAAPTPLDLRNVIIKIRCSKLPDPNEIGNAGSFFHNPIIDNEQAQELLILYPKLPVYPTTDKYKSKVSAGWLIENLGLKGYRDGSVGVYGKQALVLVNHANATQTELLRFALYIQNKVAAKYKIKLNIEPIIL